MNGWKSMSQLGSLHSMQRSTGTAEGLRLAVAIGVFTAATIASSLNAAEPGGLPLLPEGSAGRVVLRECRVKVIDQVTLSCDRTGVLKFVEVREGDPVAAKQIVGRVNDDVALAQLAVAERKSKNNVEIRYSEIAGQMAQLEYEKAVEANLGVANTVPLLEVKKLKLAAERAVLQLEQAENEFALAQLEFAKAKAEADAHAILAPISGIVTKLHKQSGEAIRAGDPVIELTSTDRVRVEGYLPLEYAWRVEMGTPVTVRVSIPDVELPVEKGEFPGRISFVDVQIQPVTRQAKVWADVVNTDNLLRAGLIAEMELPISANAVVARKPVIPAEADDSNDLPQRDDRSPRKKPQVRSGREAQSR